MAQDDTSEIGWQTRNNTLSKFTEPDYRCHLYSGREDPERVYILSHRTAAAQKMSTLVIAHPHIKKLFFDIPSMRKSQGRQTGLVSSIYPKNQIGKW